MDEPQGPPSGTRAGAGRARPVLEYVVSAGGSKDGWVKVVLRWPDGATTSGAASATERREARARAATAALGKALLPALRERGARVDLDHVFIHSLGGYESVIVRGSYDAPVKSCDIAGAAVIRDDVASAAARAFLHAVNRPLTYSTRPRLALAT